MAAAGGSCGVTPMTRVLLGMGLAVMLATLVPAAASSDEALDRASALASEKRYPEARAILDSVLERDADHPRARLLDGFVRAHEGQIGKAIEIFDRLRRDHPDMWEPWINLAVLYAAEGRLHEARETLSAALERKPSAIGHANLGDIYASLARRAYGRARELGSGVGTPPDTAAEPGPGLALPAPPAAGALANPPPAEPAGVLAHPRAQPVVCLRAGGFEDRGDLSGAQEWLESRGAEVVELRREKHPEVRSHQVYIPPLEDRAKAVAKLREIRAHGVNDVAVIREGPLANAISLGVFTVEGNRNRRVAALERLGYRPLSRDRVELVHRFYLESRTAEAPEAIRAAWAERFPERSLEPVDCG